MTSHWIPDWTVGCIISIPWHLVVVVRCGLNLYIDCSKLKIIKIQKLNVLCDSQLATKFGIV